MIEYNHLNYNIKTMRYEMRRTNDRDIFDCNTLSYITSYSFHEVTKKDNLILCKQPLLFYKIY